MIADIIETVPWHCGERDCPVGWHQANYWFDEGSETGYTVDNYGDGDHETVEQADIPSPSEVEWAWRDYAEDVARTGQDPLGNYNVDHAVKKKERWKFLLERTPDGTEIRFVEARHGRKSIRASERSRLPKYVQEYLFLDPETGLIRAWEGETMTPEQERKYLRGWFTETIEHDEPRPKETVARELRAAARRHLRRRPTYPNPTSEPRSKAVRGRKDWDPRREDE